MKWTLKTTTKLSTQTQPCIYGTHTHINMPSSLFYQNEVMPIVDFFLPASRQHSWQDRSFVFRTVWPHGIPPPQFWGQKSSHLFQTSAILYIAGKICSINCVWLNNENLHKQNNFLRKQHTEALCIRRYNCALVPSKVCQSNSFHLCFKW